MSFTENQALERAVWIGARSPCEKSKRGVVVWHPDFFDILCANHNHPPKGFACTGSEDCRKYCGSYCVHAEMAAILDAKQGLTGFHMLHVKVKDGEGVPSGPPSCVQCSKHILQAGIATMWLLHEEGLRGYSAQEFHELSMLNNGLPFVKS